MRVKYIKVIDNPEYRYGDLHRPSRIELVGFAEIHSVVAIGNRIEAVLVNEKDNKLFSCPIDNLWKEVL